MTFQCVFYVDEDVGLILMEIADGETIDSIKEATSAALEVRTTLSTDFFLYRGFRERQFFVVHDSAFAVYVVQHETYPFFTNKA